MISHRSSGTRAGEYDSWLVITNLAVMSPSDLILRKLVASPEEDEE